MTQPPSARSKRVLNRCIAALIDAFSPSVPSRVARWLPRWMLADRADQDAKNLSEMARKSDAPAAVVVDAEDERGKDDDPPDGMICT